MNTTISNILPGQVVEVKDNNHKSLMLVAEVKWLSEGHYSVLHYDLNDSYYGPAWRRCTGKERCRVLQGKEYADELGSHHTGPRY